MATEFTNTEKTMTCKWCGKKFTVHCKPLGLGWDYKGHKGYCSNKCMNEAQDKEKEEDEERRREKEKEREAYERDKERAKVLKEEGKKWLALWRSAGEGGRAAIVFFTIFLLFLGFIITKTGTIEVGIILLLIGSLGLIFAGFSIKDALK